MLKAVIFDLDDTLYDQAPYIDQGFQAVARKIQKDFGLGGPKGAAILKKMRDLYKTNNRLRIFNQVLEYFFSDISPKAINEYVERELLYYYKLCPRKISLRPQARTLMTFLRKRKMALGLVTQGNPVDQTNKLFELGLMDAFDAIEISGYYPSSKAKPNPFMFKRVLDRLKATPDEAIYVGNDLLKDIGALKAGMTFFYLVPSQNAIIPQDLRIKTIYQLSELRKEFK